jgi:hypothetical protein
MKPLKESNDGWDDDVEIPSPKDAKLEWLSNALQALNNELLDAESIPAEFRGQFVAFSKDIQSLKASSVQLREDVKHARSAYDIQVSSISIFLTFRSKISNCIF